MRPFLLACFVALAAARPEPPVGYSYQAPSGGHSLGGGSLSGGALGGGSVQYASNGGYSYASGGHGGLGGGNGGLSLGGHGGGASLDSGSFGGHSSFGNGGLSGGHGVSSGFDSSSSFTGGLNGGHGGIGGGNGGGFGGNGGFGGLTYAPQAPTVHKHVYVHVAPEEPEERRAPQHIPVAAPQKHYKIIFIKAPAPPTPTAPVIPVQPQNEEKTLVYVLVKKPEEQPEFHIPTPAPTQPSKPEVYFIRYKTQKEQSHGGADLQGPSGPSGIEGTAPGSGVIANTGLEGLGGHGLGGSSLGGSSHGGSLGGGSLGGISHGGSSSLGGDLSSGPGISYIPPSSGGAGGSSSKYGPPGYHK